jgi:hypothetical protein
VHFLAVKDEVIGCFVGDAGGYLYTVAIQFALGSLLNLVFSVALSR